MAYYRNSHPQGLHFQPPVPDTTYGPMTHIYVPRQDNIAAPIVPGGPAQVCNPSGQWPAATQIQMAMHPNTALVPVQHTSFVPSHPLYAS